jgi:hypothetical protein
MFKVISSVIFITLTIHPVYAQSVRDHTRPQTQRDTSVSASQAVDLTLTLTQAAVRPIQTWVRTAGAIDNTGRILTARLNAAEAGLVKVGQRVRAFPPESRSSMYQAKITRVAGSTIEATLPGKGRENSRNYVMEIVVDQGDFLSVPNEAIIEEGDKHIVYIEMHPGHYVPAEIHTGIQGELYTQVLHGLNEGDQVVTFGSFFIDSEHKLKSTTQGPTGTLSNDHQHH